MECYCKTCDETVEKVKGVNTCKDCKSSLLYQCITCCNRYSNLICAYQHVRSCLQLDEFHCSECGFQTNYKSSLVNHIESKHVLQECEVCDVICENRRNLLKHQKYECKGNQRVKSNQIFIFLKYFVTLVRLYKDNILLQVVNQEEAKLLNTRNRNLNVSIRFFI